MDFHKPTYGQWTIYRCAKCGTEHRTEVEHDQSYIHDGQQFPAGWANVQFTVYLDQETEASRAMALQADLARQSGITALLGEDKAREMVGYLNSAVMQYQAPYMLQLMFCPACDLSGVLEAIRKEASDGSASGVKVPSIFGRPPTREEQAARTEALTGELVNLFNKDGE